MDSILTPSSDGIKDKTTYNTREKSLILPQMQ